LLLTSCAFVPRIVDVASADRRIAYPRDSYAPQYRVTFGPFEDRRASQTRLGVGRNKLMMVPTTVSIDGDLRSVFERLVRQNFAANSIGDGQSPILIRGALLDAATNAVGPDHVFVEVTASLTVLDSTRNMPLLHRVLKGRRVTPVTQLTNEAWEDAFVGALNQINDQVRAMAEQMAGVFTKTAASPVTTPPAPPSPPSGLNGTCSGEITGNAHGEVFRMQVTFTVVQSGDGIAGAWTTTGGTSGTVTGVLTEAGIRQLKARQLNPCAGEFNGVAVVEAGGSRLRGSYVGADCNGSVTASFVVQRYQ
jgi:hypothetical protein